MNAIAQVFIHGYPELIQSDNWKEFTDKILYTYFTEKGANHIYRLFL